MSAMVLDGVLDDGSAESDQRLSVRQFKSYLGECRFQPSWRSMADKCADYYDGNQLDQATLQDLEAKGMGPLQRNIIAPLVNVVLGMEAKTRTDWRVVADSDPMQDVAEAMSAELHEAERETRADRACSDSYAAQIKAGLGWVEVSRNNDPFDYPYRCQYVHRREIWWDWRDTDTLDLRKARYLLRKRWFDLDQVCAYFPKHKELLRAALGDPNQYEMLATKRALDLGMSLEEDRGLDIEDYETWRQDDRERLALYEMWYRIFVRGIVAKMPNGEVIELDRTNPLHVALASRRMIQPYTAVYSKLRMSMWVGPHRMVDMPVKSRSMPYVPFWGYREDRTGVPYGLIRTMLTPQDEVNARLQKMMWLLGAKRVRMDSDALDAEMQSPQDMLQELARPDAVVFLDPKRTNRQGSFEVDDNLQLADAQFKVLQDAMQSAQQVVGVFNAMLGRDSTTTAASAINSLVEQGMTALAEINDNYRFARRLVGERLLELVREDMIGRPVDVVTGEEGRRRVISLNQPVRVPANSPEAQAAMQATPQEQAAMQLKNNVAAAKTRVALDDIPSSPAYREQQFTMLAELTKGLPPQMQAAIAPFIIEASDLRRRREVADTLRKAMGQPIPRTPEEEQQMQAAQEEAMAFAQQAQQKSVMLELAEREAKVEKLRAEAAKTMAEATAAGAGNPELDSARMEHEQRVREVETKAREQIDKLAAELITVRSASAMRETKLIGELSKAVAELKANAGNAHAELRRAEVQKEIAKIEADRDREVARINSESSKVIESLTEQMASMREQFATQLAVAEKATAKAVESAVKGVEKKVDQVAEEARRASVESAKRGAEDKPAQVQVVLAAEDQEVEPSKTSIKLRKLDDGSWEGEKLTSGGKSRRVVVRSDKSKK